MEQSTDWSDLLSAFLESSGEKRPGEPSQFDRDLERYLERDYGHPPFDSQNRLAAYLYAGKKNQAGILLKQLIKSNYHLRYSPDRYDITVVRNDPPVYTFSYSPRGLVDPGYRRYPDPQRGIPMQILQGMYIDLCGGDPQVAWKYFDMAQQYLGAYVRNIPDPDASPSDLHWAMVWRGYALFMAGVYDEAHELFTGASALLDALKKGRRSMPDENRVGHALIRLMVPLCPVMGRKDASVFERIMTVARKDFLKRLPEEYFRFTGYLLLFHVLSRVETAGAPDDHGAPRLQLESAGDTDPDVMVYAGRNLARGNLGSRTDLQSFQEWCSGKGNFPALSCLTENLRTFSPFDPVEIGDETARLLLITGIPQDTREIALILNDIAGIARSEKASLVLGYDCETGLPREGRDATERGEPGRPVPDDSSREEIYRFAESLIPDFVSNDPYPRAIGQMKNLGKYAVPALRRLVSQYERLVRKRAIEVLAGIHTDDARELLTCLIADPDEEICFAAARAFASHNGMDIPQVTLTRQSVRESRPLHRKELPSLLRPLLDSPDPVIRSRATIACSRQSGWWTDPTVTTFGGLARMDESLRTGNLVALVRAPGEKEKRLEAAKTLAGRKDPSAIPAFVSLLDDPDTDLQVAGLDGLGTCGATGQAEAVRQKIGAPDVRVRTAAASALVALGEPDGTGLFLDVFSSSKMLFKWNFFYGMSEKDTGKIAILEALLRKKGKRWDKLKAEALHRLAEIRHPRCLDHAVSCFRTRDPHLKKECLLIMEPSGDSRVAGLLESCISAGDPVERIRAIRGLGRCGNCEITPLLCNQAADRDPRVREAVAEALGRLGDRQASETLIRLLGDPHSYVRKEAARALGTAGSPGAAGPLTGALHDSSPYVREHAARSLGDLGCDQASVPLRGSLKDPVPSVRRAAAEALGKLGDPGAIDLLLPLLSDRIGFVRAGAVRALGSIGTGQIVPALQAVCEKDPGKDENGIPVAHAARDAIAVVSGRSVTGRS